MFDLNFVGLSNLLGMSTSVIHAFGNINEFQYPNPPKCAILINLERYKDALDHQWLLISASIDGNTVGFNESQPRNEYSYYDCWQFIGVIFLIFQTCTSESPEDMIIPKY